MGWLGEGWTAVGLRFWEQDNAPDQRTRNNVQTTEFIDYAPFTAKSFRFLFAKFYAIGAGKSVMLSREDKLASRPKFCPRPRTRPRRIVLGLGFEHLSSACRRTFYFGLVKMTVMMELVILVSLQWLSTKVIHLLTLCYCSSSCSR